jgi:Domain of unknown function (DUF5666)
VIRMTRQVLVSFALIAVLSLSLAAAWAQSQPQPSQPQSTPGSRANGLGGTIASVSDGAFVLTTRDGRSVTVRTTASTRIVSPQPATLADIHPGDRVRILATKTADGSLTARAVQDLPSSLQTTTQYRGGAWQGRDAVMIAGTVTGNPTAGALVIASSNGQSTSVAIPSTARVSRLVSMPVGTLAAGARAMVQGTPNADGSVTASVVFLAGPRGK